MKEEINQHYKACLDSVNLINKGCPEDTSPRNWEDTKLRNQEHLKIMLDKPYWTKKHDEVEGSLQPKHDLKPIKEAIKL